MKNLAELGNSTWKDQPTKLAEALAVGLSFATLTLCYLVPYTYAICWMVADKHLDRKSFQRIMIALGPVDMMQLVVNGLIGSGFIMARTDIPFWLNKTLGAFLNTSFIVHSSLATLLAFNRYVVMCLSQEWRQAIFSRHRTDAMISGCYIYGLCFLVAYLCPNIDVLLRVHLFSWQYSDTDGSHAVFFVELVQDFAQISLIIVFYTAVVIKMKRLVANMSSSLSSRTSTNREIGVSVQAGLVSMVVTIGLIIWFAAPQLSANRWSHLAANMFWLATAGTNAWIYFVFNKQLRRHATKFVHCVVRRRYLDNDESAYSSSNNHGSQRQKRTMILMASETGNAQRTNCKCKAPNGSPDDDAEQA